MKNDTKYDDNLNQLQTKNSNEMLKTILISLILAIYLLLVSYPGVLYSDSYGRWDTAKAILLGAYNSDLSTISSWLSITPSFFMAILYAFTFNIASFTLVQAFLFFFSSFLLINRLTNYKNTIIKSIFVICPIFYGYSVYHEMSIGFLVGFNIGFLLLFYKPLEEFNYWNKSKKVLYLFGLFVSFYITFGFRQNAFTILPVLLTIIIFFYFKYRKKTLMILQLTTICFSVIFVSLFPKILGIRVYSSSPAGFVWEILSTIQLMTNEKQLEYNNYLDFIAGDGCTKSALQVNNDISVNSWLWEIFTSSKIGDEKNQKEIFNRYINLFINEPNYFLKNKLNFIDRNLGISTPLMNAEYDYNRWDRLQNYGMVDNIYRHFFVDSYNKFIDTNHIFRIPWIWFVLGLIATIYSFKFTKEAYTYLFLYFTSIFYYGAFLINSQSFEFRYFFPSFYMLFIIILTSLMNFINKVFKLIIKNVESPKTKRYLQ